MLGACSGGGSFVMIPTTSYDGIIPLPVSAISTNLGTPPYPSSFCGGIFGFDGQSIASTVTCE